MRYIALVFLVFLGGCKDENGKQMPSWEGSFCDHAEGGVICEGQFIAYGSPEFKALWITNKKGTFCLFKQYVNNCKEWVDDEKECEFKGEPEAKWTPGTSRLTH